MVAATTRTCKRGFLPMVLLVLASTTAALDYQRITGTGSAHCGGQSVKPRLADGTTYGWTGGTVDQCKAKCTADPTCNAFVRRDVPPLCLQI